MIVKTQSILFCSAIFFMAISGIEGLLRLLDCWQARFYPSPLLLDLKSYQLLTGRGFVHPWVSGHFHSPAYSQKLFLIGRCNISRGPTVTSSRTTIWWVTTHYIPVTNHRTVALHRQLSVHRKRETLDALWAGLSSPSGSRVVEKRFTNPQGVYLES